MIHRYDPTHYYNTFGPHEPALRVSDGDTIITTTLDARGRDAGMQELAERPNPLTGPFYIEGADPAICFGRHRPSRPIANMAGAAPRWPRTWSMLRMRVNCPRPGWPSGK